MRKKTWDKTYITYLIPIVMAVVILPLLVAYREVENLLAGAGWQNPSPVAADIFLCVKKEFIFVIIDVILFCMLCFLLLGRKIFTMPKTFALLGGYLFLALLSTLFGEDSKTSWRGALEMMQPFGVLIGYLLLFYYVYIVINGEKNRKMDMLSFLNRIFVAAGLLLSVCGVLQIFGCDYLNWDWLRQLLGIANVSLVESERIVITLYHSNYVGTMMVLLIPFSYVGFHREKTCVWRGICLVSLTGMMMCLYGSQSRAGIFALAGVASLAFLFAVFQRKQNRRRIMIEAVVVFIASVLLFLFVDYVQGHKLSARFMHPDTKKMASSGFSSIETSAQDVVFEKKGVFLRANWRKEKGNLKLTLRDGDGKELTCVAGLPKNIAKLKKTSLARARKDTPVYRIEDNRYQGIYVQANSYFEGEKRYDGYTFFCGNRAWFFARHKGRYQFLNRMGRWDDCIASQNALPKAFYPFASYRGYAWSKTIAKLPQTLLIGVGPDNFERFFPNSDYASKALCKLDSVIYNRPHNWFLQMAAETGVGSAILLLCFLILYFVKAFRVAMSVREKEMDRQHMLCFACFLSVAGYVVTSLFCDSMIVTAPIFWVILGIGFALAETTRTGKKKIEKMSKKIQKKC